MPYLSWLKLVFDAVLETLALDLHGSENEAVANKVRRIAHALARLKTESKFFISNNFLLLFSKVVRRRRGSLTNRDKAFLVRCSQN